MRNSVGKFRLSSYRETYSSSASLIPTRERIGCSIYIYIEMADIYLKGDWLSLRRSSSACHCWRDEMPLHSSALMMTRPNTRRPRHPDYCLASSRSLFLLLLLSDCGLWSRTSRTVGRAKKISLKSGSFDAAHIYIKPPAVFMIGSWWCQMTSAEPKKNKTKPLTNRH